METNLAPLPGEEYMIENRWYEQKGNEYIIVYAGGYRKKPSQGVVFVQVQSLDHKTPAQTKGGFYTTPTANGPVRVVSAIGERITLTAADGTGFVFDVTARVFLSPLQEPGP